MAGDTGAPGFIPLYDDTTSFAPIQTPFNGISSALNSALKKNAYTTYPDLATLNLPANAGTVVGQHATVNADATTTNNGDYTWSGSAWIFAGNKLLANQQLDNSINSLQVVRFQYGISRITGNNTNVISRTVTFPVPFSAQPHVSVSYIGYRAIGSFTPGSLTAGSAKESQPQAISTTTFSASLALPPSDGTWSNGSDFYFSWLAIGPM